MPTEEWKRNNPYISGHIPKQLKDQFDQFIAEEGLSGISEALRIILENHFAKPKFSTSSQLLTKSSQLVINSFEERLKNVEALLKEHNSIIERLEDTPKTQEQKPKVLNLVSKSSQPSKSGEWLTTGEAYAELQKRGYTKSVGTFRRSLRDGVMPSELEQIGLAADWEKRRQGNPKDNSVKWLRFG